MGKQEKSVQELVDKVRRGEIRLPEMQRGYVWKATRVRDLMDSLYRGYPSGTILMWETDESPPERAFAIEQEQAGVASRLLLLDGQQRLTSLSAILAGEPVHVRGRRKPIDLLFNLEHPEDLPVITEVHEDDDGDGVTDESDATEDDLLKRHQKMTFVVSAPRLASLPNWVSVREIFTKPDWDILLRVGLSRIDDPRYQQYSDRLARVRQIRNYTYRIDVLETSRTYEEVTEIFVRVNSLGAKLRSSDLALAQITAAWQGALADFEGFAQRCAKNGFGLDVGFHVRGLIAIATGIPTFKTTGSLSKARLEAAWGQYQPAMEFAMNFLRANCGIERAWMISSPFVLLSVAYLAHVRDRKLSQSESASLRRWVHLASAKGRYSRGSSETLLAEDLRLIRDGDLRELLTRLTAQVGRLDFTEADLAGRTARSSVFRTLFLAMRAQGARDWSSKILLAPDLVGVKGRLQAHHIFPKALMKGTASPQEIDDLANLCFIGGETNRKIGKKPPYEYVPIFAASGDASLFEAHEIPIDDLSLLNPDSFKRFLVLRRERLVRLLNDFVG